jgi:integrase
VRSYVVRYRLRGSRAQRLRTLKKVSALTLEEATKRAKDVIREAEAGRDWFDTVGQERAHTLFSVWEYYRDNHLAGVDISERTRADANILWANHCEKAFKSQAVVDLSASQVRGWHKDRTASGRYVANRALQLMRAAWNYASKYGRIPEGLANPFAKVTLNAETARQTILQPAQLPAFAAAVDALPDPFARGFFWLAFYTGARKSELATLRWESVELGETPSTNEIRTGSITFGKTKNGEPFKVELSPPAIAVLEALPRTVNPHVFPGRMVGSHLDPAPYWETVRKTAKIPHLRMHDLRRSFGSWLAASGYSAKQIGVLLNHKSAITSEVYMALGQNVAVKRELVNMHAKLAREALEQAKRRKAEVLVLDAERAAG